MLDNINITKKLKIIFMGTPEFSVPTLEALIENYGVRAVITQPDRVVGRDQEVSFSPIKKVALKHTILLLQPESIKDSVNEIIALEPDLIITCAYGQIIPKAILDSAKIGCINVHASLLPKLRGGAPIHHAIIDGYKTTGITIMHMNPKMDEGDIISQQEIEITEEDTAETLHDKLMFVGRDLLIKTLPSIIDGTAPREKQDSSQATYAFAIQRKDEKIDFNRTRRQIFNQVRGLNSWPGAYCQIGAQILKVWEVKMSSNVFPETILNGQITKIYPEGIGVKVSNGEIIITSLQLEGRKRMSAVDFVNGINNKDELVGKILS